METTTAAADAAATTTTTTSSTRKANQSPPEKPEEADPRANGCASVAACGNAPPLRPEACPEPQPPPQPLPGGAALANDDDDRGSPSLPSSAASPPEPARAEIPPATSAAAAVDEVGSAAPAAAGPTRTITISATVAAQPPPGTDSVSATARNPAPPTSSGSGPPFLPSQTSFEASTPHRPDDAKSGASDDAASGASNELDATSGASNEADATSGTSIEPDDIQWNGEIFVVGDYVHVANPNNPDRPNVGHIWKILKNAIKLEPRIRVCWYYRPDQTVHQATRQFWENEVFKTMKIEDVPVASVLGRCFVLPIKDYMRGRPAALAAEKKDKGADCSSSSAGGGAGEVEPKVYVCESRYIENTKMTEKIRDWGSLAPEPRKFKRKARGRLPVFLRKHDDESATGNTSLNGIVLELFPTPITLNKVPSPFASEAALAAAAVAGAELEADDKGARAASPNPAPFFKGSAPGKGAPKPTPSSLSLSQSYSPSPFKRGKPTNTAVFPSPYAIFSPSGRGFDGNQPPQQVATPEVAAAPDASYAVVGYVPIAAVASPLSTYAAAVAPAELSYPIMGPSIPKYPYNPSASQQVHGERNGAPEHMQHIQRQPPQIPPAAAAAQVSVARKPQQREQQFSGGGGVATTVGAARPSTTTEIISPSTNGVEGSAPFVEDGLAKKFALSSEGQILWFATPPLNMTPPPGMSISHSRSYIEMKLANKRRKLEGISAEEAADTVPRVAAASSPALETDES